MAKLFSTNYIMNNWCVSDWIPPGKCECELLHICQKSSAWYDLIENRKRDSNFSSIFESIKNKGFVVPIVAQKYKSKVFLIDGHSRFVAAFLLGKDIPVVTFNTNVMVQDIIALDSNRWREGLDPRTQVLYAWQYENQ